LWTTYDPLGNLTGARTPNRDTLTYLVDGANRRVGRFVNGYGRSSWLYGGGIFVTAELDSTGAVRNRYAYGSGGQTPDLMVQGGATYRLITDHLGSVRAVVDVSTGALAQQIDYDSWGVITTDTAPGFQSLGYAGGLVDRETGLIRFGARDYEPGTGRWTRMDPIGFASGDVNLYSYVAAQPLSVIDPSGLDGGWIHNGTVINLSDKCLLVSGSNPNGPGQLQYWIPPHTIHPHTPYVGNDIDAIFVNGKVIKIKGVLGSAVVYKVKKNGSIDPRLLPRPDALLDPSFTVEEWAKVNGGIIPPAVVPAECKCQAEAER
jgi:RHS repeat-associated protein